MKVAWFTPLPPMPSGIADYSSEILPVVAERADVDVYCPRPGLLRKARPPRGVGLRDPKQFADGYDACFYHLGNNPYHEFVYKAAKDHPAIAVFHDAVLHHLIAFSTFESRRDYAGYEEILREELGPRGSRLAALRRLGLATEFEKFVFPLTEHVAQRSRGIVVHSEDAAVRMQEVAPDVPLAVVPHHAGEAPPSVAGITRAEARDRLGLPQDAFVVGHLGFITKPKQPGAVVGGFARLRAEFPDALLLMVGADRTGGGLAKLISDLGVGGSVRMAGYVDLPQFYLYLKALDAMINLRYPSAGESSGTFSRALAEGRAVIVNNYGSFAEVPGDVSLKVEIDAPQAEQVGEHLLHLARDPLFRSQLEARARDYALRVLDPGRCRDLYLAFAQEVAARGPNGGQRVRRALPATFSESVARYHGLAERARAVQRGALGRAGTATYVDELYRTLLRRPAEQTAIREAHAALVAGGLSRAELAERIVRSREFSEVRLIEDILRDLPEQFTLTRPTGPDTTERVVEIPWMLSRWRREPHVLDVGYAYASDLWLTGLLDRGIPDLHGVDMAWADVPGMHGVQADVRALPYGDGAFDLVYCVSTLEHVGKSNARYGLASEVANPDADVRTLRELARVLSEDGRILVSVPFGRREDHGWLIQYDEESWNELVAAAGLRTSEQETYRLTSEGWVLEPDPGSMADLSYGDGAPAARGVLCTVLTNR